MKALRFMWLLLNVHDTGVVFAFLSFTPHPMSPMGNNPQRGSHTMMSAFTLPLGPPPPWMQPVNSKQGFCPLQMVGRQEVIAFGGKCYQFVQTGRTWLDARDHCQQLGGDLAVADTGLLIYFLRREMHTSNYHGFMWIGLIGGDRSYQAYWVNGKKSQFNYHFGHCGALRSYPYIGGFTDHLCKEKYPYVCQYASSTAATTTKPRPTSTFTASPSAVTNSPQTVTAGRSATVQAVTSTQSSTKTSTGSMSTMPHLNSSQSPTKPSTTSPLSPSASTTVNIARHHSSISSKSKTTTQVSTRFTTKTSTSRPIATMSTSTKSNSAGIPTTTYFTCPVFSCVLDCGIFGYKVGKDGCPICKCLA